ncbi:MAG: oligosaccharide flippase family protein [Rubrivivax sp.]|nr:oligosaccharide flippase family protein [Rubrivivax sp.]
MSQLPPAAGTPPRPPSPSRLPRRWAALLEQVLVSGASFIAFLLLARGLTPEAWGSFGLAFALVLFAQGFQRALVTLPMLSFGAAVASAPGDAFPGRGAWSAANTALAATAAALLAAAAGVAALARAGWVVDALGMAALLMLPAMGHEFARRAAVQAARLDLLAGMGAVFAAVLLAMVLLPLPPAWRPWQPALGLGLAWTAAAALHAARSGLALWPRPGRPPRLAGYAAYGRWALGSHLAYSGYNFGVQALLAALAGPAALGAFHACRALVQPVSTLQAAMDSVDKPRAAAALARDGSEGLRRVLRRSFVTVAGLALPYLAVVSFAAGPLLTLAYGERYAGQQAVVSMWCLVALCSLLSQPVESGLYVARCTRALFWARVLAAVLGLGTAFPLIAQFGAAGALAAMALGFALAAGAGLFHLQRLPARHAMTEPPENVTTAAAAMAPRAVYLAWAGFQRRQVSMADAAGFDCVFLPLAYKGRSHPRRALHYAALFVRTLAVLRARRPPVAWLQLPQLPLLWAALLYRALFDRRLVLVADCHNAVFRAPWSRLPLGLSLLARCEAVLVHNRDMHAAALALGVPAARLRVLEDVPPRRAEGPPPPVPAAFAGRPHPWVLFAGSYGHDEPVAEVLQAARELGGGVVAVTGRLGNAGRNGHDIARPPANVVLTDYLPLADFEALLVHCDVVLAFTRFDGIQLSVCNEALGFGRPMVVSDTPLLRELFGQAGVMVDSADPAAIVRGVRLACAEAATRAAASRALALQRRQRWQAGPLLACQALLRREPARTAGASA